MGVPKGEKKQLIKFVPSVGGGGDFPRGRKIKFSTALLAWQELGGVESSWASLLEKDGAKLLKQHEQDQLF